MSLNFPTPQGALTRFLIKFRARFQVWCLVWCVLIFTPGVIVAGEWINVLDPGQRISKDGAGSFKDFKTIPDLAVVSVRDKTAAKTVNVKYEIHAVLKDAVQKENKSYDTLFVPGCGYHFDPGQPDIPAKSIFLEIPMGSRYSVSVKSPKTTRLENIDFLPAQPLPQDNMAFEPIDFEKDTTLYSQDALFPKNNIISTREFKVRGHRMLEVVVSPIQYNPVTKTVKMSPSLDVRVDIQKGSTGRSAGGGFRDSGYMDLFSSGLKDLSGVREMKTAPAKPLGLEKYMILMNPQFKGNELLKEFILWKKKKGYDVTVVTTADVNAKAGSNDTFNNCVKFMRSLPQSDYPNYLLIIGDHTPENGLQSNYIKTYMGGYSDLFLACRDETDYLPDLYHGRLPASSNEELDVMLKKILAMDQNPPGAGMYDKVLVAGQIQDRQQGKDGKADRLFFETGDALAVYFENNKKTQYECTSVFENPDGMLSEGFWNTKGFLWAGEIIGQRPMKRFLKSSQSVPLLTDKINKGLALIQYRAHGEPLGWGHPKWTSTQVDELVNGENQPVVFSVTCLTGAYHNPDNFSKKLLTHLSGGAYAVISSVDVSYSWTNDMFVHGLYTAFLDDYISSQRESVKPQWTKKLSPPSLFKEGSANRLGAILNSGLLYLYEHFNIKKLTKETFELFHLFGDPESFIRFHEPTKFSRPQYPETISADRKQTLKITGVEKGTVVSLFSDNPDMGLHLAKVAEGQQVGFALLPKDEGTIYVTLSKYGKIPYQGRIKVLPEVTPPSNVEKEFIEVDDPNIPENKDPKGPVGSESEYKSVF